MFKKWQISFLYILGITFWSASAIAAVVAPDLGIECKIFNVGQGNGVAVKDRMTGEYLLIDSGTSGGRTQEEVLKEIKDFIIPAGIAHHSGLCIVASHPDKDHINIITKFLNGNNGILCSLPISIYIGGPLHKYLETGEGKRLLSSIKDLLESHDDPTKCKIQSLSHQINLDVDDIEKLLDETVKVDHTMQRPFFMNVRIPEFTEGTRLSSIILAANGSHDMSHPNFHLQDLTAIVPMPGHTVSDENNNNSAVVKVSYQRKSIVFPGDIEGAGTTRMLLSSVPAAAAGAGAGTGGLAVAPDLLKANVLIASHHGAESERANDSLWVMRTDPDYIVVSAGEYEGYYHPRFSTSFIFAETLKRKVGRVPNHPFTFFDEGKMIRNVQDLIKGHFNPYGAVATSNLLFKGKDYTKVALTDMSLPLYSTYSSGTITITISPDGTLAIG